MAKQKNVFPACFPEIRQLYYFAVTAEEMNISRAAERLFIAQPPLSRQIRQLEDMLGFELFDRRSKGLSLTDKGAETLKAAQELLAAHANAREKLLKIAGQGGRSVSVGLTTAFEQGIFAGLLQSLAEVFERGLRVERAASPRLIRLVRQGRLDFAVVALPLETKGLACLPLAYEEPMVAALPEAWAEACEENLSLSRLDGKPMFWFRREANPAFFDFTRAVFAREGFNPVYKPEPQEHDVLLARVAAGEAGAFLSSSFSILHRKGLVYRSLREGEHLRLGMGVVALPEDSTLSLVHGLASAALGRRPVQAPARPRPDPGS